MDKKTREFVIEKTHELMNAETCCDDAKKSGADWLASVGTSSEKSESEKYVKELEEDIESIDELISFTRSADAVKFCGEQGAKDLAAHADRLKADGAAYCDCPACAAALAIIEKKDLMIK